MRRLWWKALLVASLCLNVGFLAHVGMRMAQHHERHGMSELKLNPEAQAQMEARFKSFRDRLGPLQDELRTERLAMLALLASDNPSPEAVRAQEGRMMAVVERILQTTDTHFLDQKRNLSPEQRRLFFEHLGRRLQEPDRRSPFP